VFTTATFIGYVLAGWRGAFASTAGIFLPAFVFVAVSEPLVRRVAKSPALRSLLDGINVGAVALMLVVTWQLGRAAFDGAATVLMSLAALALLSARVNSAVVIVAGAVAGLLMF
jgi:chromate transporter